MQLFAQQLGERRDLRQQVDPAARPSADSRSVAPSEWSIVMIRSRPRLAALVLPEIRDSRRIAAPDRTQQVLCLVLEFKARLARRPCPHDLLPQERV
jgi:hypothetical protein